MWLREFPCKEIGFELIDKAHPELKRDNGVHSIYNLNYWRHPLRFHDLAYERESKETHCQVIEWFFVDFSIITEEAKDVI